MRWVVKVCRGRQAPRSVLIVGANQVSSAPLYRSCPTNGKANCPAVGHSVDGLIATPNEDGVPPIPQRKIKGRERHEATVDRSVIASSK